MYPSPSPHDLLTISIIVIVAILCLLPFIAWAAMEVYLRLKPL